MIRLVESSNLESENVISLNLGSVCMKKAMNWERIIIGHMLVEICVQVIMTDFKVGFDLTAISAWN